MKDEQPKTIDIDERGKPANVLASSSGFAIQLEMDCTVRQAFCRICRQLVESMEHNYDGVLEDIDSEFLHDFRVAVRRTRSLVSQLKKYLPAEQMFFFSAGV